MTPEPHSDTLRFMRRLTTILTILVPACMASDVSQQSIRAAATKAVSLVQASQKNWYTNHECTSCRNQILPALAFRVAREHGIAVDEAAARADAVKSAGIYANLDRAVQYTHFIDSAMDDGFHLVAADAMGVRPNLSTAVYARFIATRQRPEGFCRTVDVRPPQSSSFVTATAAVELNRLAQDLMGTQRDDGGWNSVNGRESDAYSTGEALVALHGAGAVPVRDARWVRGLDHGTWCLAWYRRSR